MSFLGMINFNGFVDFNENVITAEISNIHEIATEIPYDANEDESDDKENIEIHPPCILSNVY